MRRYIAKELVRGKLRMEQGLAQTRVVRVIVRDAEKRFRGLPQNRALSISESGCVTSAILRSWRCSDF